MSTQEKTMIEQWSVAPTVSLPTKKDLFEMSEGVAAFDAEANTIIAEARRNLSEVSVTVALAQLVLEWEIHHKGAILSADKNVSGTSTIKRSRRTLVDLLEHYVEELRKLKRQVTPLLRSSNNEPPAQQPEPKWDGIYLGHDLGRAFTFE